MNALSRNTAPRKSLVGKRVAENLDPRFEHLEPRLLLSALGYPEELLANTAPDISGLPDITVIEDGHLPDPGTTVDQLGFDDETSVYLTLDSEGAAGDVTPTGSSYMLTEHWGGTWSDAEKTPSNTEDDLMCWAAAASNILQWTGWGSVAGLSTTDEVFGYFQNHWTDQGGLMEYGWDWWFDGSNSTQGWSGWSQVDVAGGGFYPSESIWNYYHEQNIDSAAMSAIDQYLRAGYGVTLGIYGPGGHAITVWGYNYNPASPADYYGVWLTDSDDSKGSNTPPDLLRYYEVSLSSGKWYLQDYYGSNAWYIGTVQALDRMPGTPEPPPEPDPTPEPESDPPDPSINGVDLWAYTADAETADSALVFTLIGNTNPNCGVSIVNGRYIHVDPARDWSGTSIVTVRVSDGQLIDTDSFVITVTPVNDAPTIDTLPDQSIPEDSALNHAVDLWNYAADVDNPDSSLAFTIVGNTDANCGVSVVDGHYLNIVPAYGWTGTSDVTVQVSDGQYTAATTFRVTVASPQVDLTGAFIYTSLPTSAAPGTWGYATVRVDNAGSVAAYGLINFEVWATRDGDLTSGGDDYRIGTARRYIYAPAGGPSYQVVYYTLPQGMSAGSYQLCLVVDSSDEFSESNEDNNLTLRSQVNLVTGRNVTLDATRSGPEAIVRFYHAFLGRTPDAEGLAAWTRGYQSGMSLGTIAQGFLDSPEFAQRSNGVRETGSATDFVTWCYETILRRTPAAAEINAWVPAVQKGRLTCAQVLRRFTESTEFLSFGPGLLSVLV